MTTNTFTHLIDSGLIDAATRAHREAKERHATAEAALATAVADEGKADAAAHAAAAGDSVVSPVEAEHAFELAQRQARAALRVRDAAAKAVEHAAAQVGQATAAAHRPLSDAGLRLRAAALVRAERAKAALNAAQQDYDRSALMLNTARVEGAHSMFSGDPNHYAGMPMRPLAEEAPGWRDRRAADWDAAVEAARAEVAL